MTRETIHEREARRAAETARQQAIFGALLTLGFHEDELELGAGGVVALEPTDANVGTLAFLIARCGLEG